MNNNISGTLATASGGLFHDLWFRTYGESGSAAHSDDLFMFIFWVSVISFVILMGLMFAFCIVYRRKPGVPAPWSPSHNTPLEITWTVLPLVILAVIFFRGFHAYVDKVVPRGDAIELKLRGYQWGWELTYPNGALSPESVPAGIYGAKTLPIFYMPAGKAIKLRMTSSDVMHSFWVPDFRVKMDLFPNRYTTIWFPFERTIDESTPALTDYTKPEKPALTDDSGQEIRGYDHFVFCAEYCGDFHSEMAAIIRVVPQAYYEQKIKQWAEGTGTPVQRGEVVYNQRGCVACHSVTGAGGAGPTWKNLFAHEVEFTDGTKLTAEELSDTTAFANYIRESVYLPQQRIVKGFGPSMQSYQGIVSEKELEYLIQFMISISDTKPAGWTPEGAPPADAAPAGGTAPAATPGPDGTAPPPPAAATDGAAPKQDAGP